MSWKFLIFTSTIICCFLNGAETANILIVMPLSARSHFKSFQPLWEALIERDHNLTIIAGYELNDKWQSNYTLVDIRPLFKKLKIVFAEMRKQNRIHNLIFTNNVIQDYLDDVFQFSDVQHIINSKIQYDLVIGELFFVDATLAFGYKFDAPVVAVSPLSMISFYDWILANPFSTSYIPNTFLPLTEKITLPGRIVNTIYSFITVLFYEFVSLPRSQALIEKYFHFEKENVPHIKDIMKNISVTLVNSHYSFGYVKPDLPNVVNIAGLHFTPPTILPQNVQKFMDEAEHGVIYLSLGSLIEPEKVETLGEIFIHIMERLPQRVVMKWDPQLLTHIPKNVLVQKWFAQVDILNHPKCRLFITHGGLHSLLESLNASVPVVGIPFFTDQQHNMAIVEYYEIGTAVEIDDISSNLELKINEVLQNPKYEENIRKRSILFRERLTSPLDTALYWIDHVLKHRDTSHLKPGSAYLTWYQLYSLDILLILAVTVWIFVIIFKFLIRIIIKQTAIVVKHYLHPANRSRQKEKLVDGSKCD